MKKTLIALTFLLVFKSDASDKKDKFLEIYGQTPQRLDELSEKDFKLAVDKLSRNLKRLKERADFLINVPATNSTTTDVSKKGLLATATVEGRARTSFFSNKIVVRYRDSEGEIKKESEILIPDEESKDGDDNWDIEFRPLETRVNADLGKVIVVGSYSTKRVLFIVDIDTKKSVFKLEVPYAPVSTLHNYKLTPDGKFLVGINQKTIRLWEVTTGKEITKRFALLGAMANSLVISPDSSRIAVGTQTGQVYIINIQTGKVENTLSLNNENEDQFSSPGIVMAFSPSGEQLLAGESSQDIQQWNLKTGKKIRSIKTDSGELGNEFGGKNYILSIDFYPQGEIALIRTRTGFNRPTSVSLNVWNLRDGKTIFTENFPSTFGMVRVSPDGSFIFAENYYTHHLWKLK